MSVDRAGTLCPPGRPRRRVVRTFWSRFSGPSDGAAGVGVAQRLRQPIPVLVGLCSADRWSMSDGLIGSLPDGAAVEIRTSEAPCVVCVTSSSLDDERPKVGTVRWTVHQQGRLRVGAPIAFECPNGHSTQEDPALLKSFRSRLF